MRNSRTKTVTDMPLAARGFLSYRCKSPFGWIMIGATDHDDALAEARRSNPVAMPQDIQIWNGTRYEDAFPTIAAAEQRKRAEKVRAALLAFATERSGAAKQSVHVYAEVMAGFDEADLVEIAGVIAAA